MAVRRRSEQPSLPRVAVVLPTLPAARGPLEIKSRQKRFKDMSKQEQQETRLAIFKFKQEHSAGDYNVCDTFDDGPNEPAGILVLTVPRKRKPPLRRDLFSHQVLATNHFLGMGRDAPWDDRRVSMLLLHEVGAGKTITAILALAGVHKLNSDPVKKKTLIVVPKSMLETWEEELRAWTTLGGSILTAAVQTELTDAAISEAQVIITTPYVLVAAAKTMFYLKPAKGEDRGKPFWERLTVGVSPTDTKRLEDLNGKQPPIHPIFKEVFKNEQEPNKPPSFAMTIVDEVHTCNNPSTWKGSILSYFTQRSVYKLGLTGTPVTSKVSQLADLGHILDVRPDIFQQPDHFMGKDKNDKTINQEAFQEFHDRFVDRVDETFLDLPQKIKFELHYDPFIGLRPDGTINEAAIAGHNAKLAAAMTIMRSHDPNAAETEKKEEATEEIRDDVESMPKAPERKKWSNDQTEVFAAMVALGNYEFSPVLGLHGAAEFKKDKTLLDLAVKEASQVMHLILRVIEDRQRHGHDRIAVFCESTTQLQILERYLEDKEVGERFLFHGQLTASKRNRMVKDFLKCVKGVLLFSSAGGVGITLCPGCEVLLSVGSLPWNATTIKQADGRVFRIKQDKEVEIVQFVARRSITASKLRLHDDKDKRLGEATANLDFSNFADGDVWRWTKNVLDAVGPINSCGNYPVLPDVATSLRKYRKIAEAWEKRSQVPRAASDPPLPPKPTAPTNVPKPSLLPSQMPLPVVSWPLDLVANETLPLEAVAST
jgi:superfamily II DNA or RNA helicase